MKRIYFISTTILLFLLIQIKSSAQSSDNKKKFYYAFNEKIFIEEVPNRFVVKLKSPQKVLELRNQLQKSFQSKIRYQNETTVSIDATGSTRGIKELLKDKMADIEMVKPVYKYQQQEMSYTNEILVEPNDGIRIQQVIERIGLTGYTKIKEGKFYSVVEVASAYDACDVANNIQESGLVKYSHPNFMAAAQSMQVIPNDTYFNNQFYLRNIGQVFNPAENHFGTPNADINASFAWNTTTGSSSIIVAVLDEGVTSDHPDLPNTRQIRLNGSNFIPGQNSNNPSPDGNGNHGNSCAGIIAATQNNNEGISGIAPNVKIMPIKILSSTGSADFNGMASAIDLAWQNGAHVISNSWGYPGMTNPNLAPAIVNAINRAVTQGRSGLGCVVVFAASNTAAHVFGVAGSISFPSNVQINGVLTVGASDRDDEQTDYSPTSNTASADNQIIDIVAPSHRAYSVNIPTETYEVWTMDIPGNDGYNPNKEHDGLFGVLPPINEVLPSTGTNNLSYTGRFGGTSAACPQVAAVAALLLSMNNGLTQQQVFDIITQSAEDVGGYAYANGWCPEMGNGRLNACAALSRLPNQYPISGSGAFCTSSPYLVPGLPAGSTINWQSSDPGIATISPDGIATRVNDASGIVTFTAVINVANRCGIVSASRSVAIGVPERPKKFDENGEEITGLVVCTGTTKSICPTVGPAWGVLEYKWEKVTGNFFMGSSGACATVRNAIPASGFITVQARNACGWSNLSFYVVQIMNCDMLTTQATPQNSARLFPNPASSSVTVSIDKSGTARLKAKNEQGLANTVINEVKIYDNLGILHLSRKYNQQQTAALDVSSLKDGTYIVEINTGNGLEHQKLVIKK